MILLLACGNAAAEQFTKQVSAEVPSTWKVAAQPNRGGLLLRIYSLPNGCSVETRYEECSDCGADYVYEARRLPEAAEELGASCCATDLCMAPPVKGHKYTCDDREDIAVPATTAHQSRAILQRHDGSWIFDSAVVQFFLSRKSNVGRFFAILACPRALYAAERPEFDAFVKSIKHAKDLGPPKQ